MNWRERVGGLVVKWWWPITVVSVVAVLVVGIMVQAVGSAMVAAGTLALALATFKTSLDQAEQRRFERTPHVSLKDPWVEWVPESEQAPNGKAILVLQMVANLGLHPVLLRYVSVHDSARRRVLEVWPVPIAVERGKMELHKSFLLSRTNSDRPMDMYDDEEARVATFGNAVSEARWLRIVVQSGGMPGQDLHLWLPKYDSRPSGGPIFDHTNVEEQLRATPHNRRQVDGVVNTGRSPSPTFDSLDPSNSNASHETAVSPRRNEG